MRSIARLSALPWLGLTVILVLFVAAIISLHPVNFFGLPSDDAVYFSSAQALAEGRGYVLPSVPGTPPATKFPVLLPWLLKFVWRYDSSFPGNLPVAIAVIVLFGCLFSVAAFSFLKRQVGITHLEVLLLTAFCTLHPLVLYYGSALVSEIPFAFLALAAMNFADRAMRRDAKLAGSAITGLLAGLSILMRVMGVPIAGGIFLCAIWRRAWRQAAVLAATSAPFFFRVIWVSVFKPIAAPPAPFAWFGAGWEQTWIYYTSYSGVWKLNLINFGLTGRMLFSQVLYFISDLPGYFIWPLFHKNIVVWFVTTLVTFGILCLGIRAQAIKSGWRPVHFCGVLYVAMILLWHYIVWQRFLLPFLPGLAAGFYFGTKQLVLQLWNTSSKSQSLPDKMAAGASLVAISILIAGVTSNFLIAGQAELRSERQKREGVVLEKREVYDWITRNTPQGARVVTDDEDAALYLFTGRQAMVVIAFLQAGAYDEQVKRRDLDHILDVSQAIGAPYWVLSDETGLPWRAFTELKMARLNQLSGVLPELFRSRKGHVRILDLACVRQLEAANCRAIATTLFPDAAGAKNRR